MYMYKQVAMHEYCEGVGHKAQKSVQWIFGAKHLKFWF